MELYKGNCDICTKADGAHSHNIQKCRVCSVLVHELCYGMPPTTTKNSNFICHACNAINSEIEINGISRSGGLKLKDVLSVKEGREALKEFITTTRQQQQQSQADDNIMANNNMIDCYTAIMSFNESHGDSSDSSNNDKTLSQLEREEMFELSIKEEAQNIFDMYCATNAEKKIALLDAKFLADIEKKIFRNDKDIASTLFDKAKESILTLLESTTLFERYKQSSTYTTYLASQRTIFKQVERPTECVLCSVATGKHAMHPLYDTHGKDGRQVLIPASGVGITKHKPERLAWVHTLCAMFICSGDRTGGLIYGCNEDGEWEMPSDEEEDDDEEEDEEDDGGKVIESDDDEDEDEDESDEKSNPLGEEQIKFANCEGVYNPLLDRLQDATINIGDNSSKDKNAIEVLQCINSMIEYIQVLTPSYVELYPLGVSVGSAKKKFESTHPDVKAKCKLLSKLMKKMYEKKKKLVPDTFKPQKKTNYDYGGASHQKYNIGSTKVAKEFRDQTFNGTVTEYNTQTMLYRIVYTDGDYEDVSEPTVAKLLLTSTAFFCFNEEEEWAIRRIKEQRGLVCVVCEKKDSNKDCLRLPVQCSAGDQYQWKELKKYHRGLNSKKKKLEEFKNGHHGDAGCTKAVHVGCARWAAASKYAKINDKSLKMCYFFPGMPPTYNGEDGYPDPVSNCYCRIHAREIQEGLAREGLPSPIRGRKRKPYDNTDSLSNVESEHELVLPSKDAIAKKKKKKRRIMQDDEEESD